MPGQRVVACLPIDQVGNRGARQEVTRVGAVESKPVGEEILVAQRATVREFKPVKDRSGIGIVGIERGEVNRVTFAVSQHKRAEAPVDQPRKDAFAELDDARFRIADGHGCFDDRIDSIARVEDISVLARAAVERVVARAADQRVVAT